MTAGLLLEKLQQQGVRVVADGSALVCEDPGEVINDVLLAEIRARKGDLLRLLTSTDTAPPAAAVSPESVEGAQVDQLAQLGLYPCTECGRIQSRSHLRQAGEQWVCVDLTDCGEAAALARRSRATARWRERS